MMHPSPPGLPPGVVRGDMVSGGGTFGAAPANHGSSGGVELSVVMVVVPLVQHPPSHDVLYIKLSSEV